jgi:hypothetical protein
MDDGAPLPDCGSLYADLTVVVDRLLAAMATPAARDAVAGLLGDSGADLAGGDPAGPDLAGAERARAALALCERAGVLTALDRAVARGELRSRPDPQLVQAVLVGTVFAALFLVRFDPADLPARLAHVVQSACAGEGGSDLGRVAAQIVVPAW